MFISAVESFYERNSPVELLPRGIRKLIYISGLTDFTEIRLRRGQPVTIIKNRKNYYLLPKGGISEHKELGIRATGKDIEEALDILTDCSVYTYKDEIKNGYITAPGGHRVGLCGCMTSDGEFVRDVSGINYRYAREFIGCANGIADKVFNNGDVKSTLIISRPGCGKTTFLRDLIRQVSDLGCKVSVVDERCEIAAVNIGIPGFDLGVNTDVFSMVSKRRGINMMLRSMSPAVIAVDEFELSCDGDIIFEALRTGVSIFATVHGNDLEKFRDNHLISNFGCVVLLSDRNGPGTVERCMYA